MSAPPGPGTADGRRLSRIGTITAGFTHDIRNVLSVINESAGLIEDVLSSAAIGAPAGKTGAARPSEPAPPIDRALASIRRQIAHGTDTCVRLSRFAHTMDRDTDFVSINDVMEQTVFLMRRPAVYREASLVCRPLETDIELPGNAFDAIMSLCEGIDRLLACPVTAIELVAGETDRGTSGSRDTAPDRQPARAYILLSCEPSLDTGSLPPLPGIDGGDPALPDGFEAIVTPDGRFGGLRMVI